MRTPYLALLQAGFTVPVLLPGPRWALTPPFHPYRYRSPGGLLSVALSLGSRRAGITRRLVSMEPGLSSCPLQNKQLPGHLVTLVIYRDKCAIARRERQSHG